MTVLRPQPSSHKCPCRHHRHLTQARRTRGTASNVFSQLVDCYSQVLQYSGGNVPALLKDPRSSQFLERRRDPLGGV
jgi:serine phosphatase RsbU (regulator of sigma subunit)